MVLQRNLVHTFLSVQSEPSLSQKVLLVDPCVRYDVELPEMLPFGQSDHLWMIVAV